MINKYNKIIYLSIYIILPAARTIYGSLMSVRSEAPSTGSPDTPGFNTVNCNTI